MTITLSDGELIELLRSADRARNLSVGGSDLANLLAASVDAMPSRRSAGVRRAYQGASALAVAVITVLALGGLGTVLQASGPDSAAHHASAATNEQTPANGAARFQSASGRQPVSGSPGQPVPSPWWQSAEANAGDDGSTLFSVGHGRMPATSVGWSVESTPLTCFLAMQPGAPFAAQCAAAMAAQ